MKSWPMSTRHQDIPSMKSLLSGSELTFYPRPLHHSIHLPTNSFVCYLPCPSPIPFCMCHLTQLYVPSINLPLSHPWISLPLQSSLRSLFAVVSKPTRRAVEPSSTVLPINCQFIYYAFGSQQNTTQSLHPSTHQHTIQWSVSNLFKVFPIEQCSEEVGL